MKITITTTKERFLEEAIRTARNEIVEEVAAINEGADVEVSTASILKIIEDLVNTAEHFEDCSIEESETERGISLIPEESTSSMTEDKDVFSFFSKDIKGSKFKIGSAVKIINADSVLEAISTFRKFSLEREKSFVSHAVDGIRTFVLGVCKVPHTKCDFFYIVQLRGGLHCFIKEDGLDFRCDVFSDS